MIQSRSALVQLVNDGLIEGDGGEIKIDEVSICLHLDSSIRVYDAGPHGPIIPPVVLRTHTIPLTHEQGHVLAPRESVLGCSREIVRMPLEYMGFIQTKGSLARGFLFAHACDGQIDPGYSGKVTFEIMNFSEFYYRLVPEIPFATMFVHKIDPALTPPNGYHGRYQNSSEPTPMRPAR